MATAAADVRAQLELRRERLQAISRRAGAGAEVDGLLRDLDDALDRLSRGVYGICETCGEPIEADHLAADPLARFCLGDLTPVEARALEQDLDLASRVQQTLLPPSPISDGDWEIAYQYQPLGPVSGDYVDVIRAASPGESLTVLLGDISGKGVAASMLMAHLHASLRTLVGFGLPLDDLVHRANRVFCESTMANHYATLVAARFAGEGIVEICNAGHCPPLLVRGAEVSPIEANAVPIGLFCVRTYAVRTLSMQPGDSLVLYTDGITEARNHADEDYGTPRLASLVAGFASDTAQTLVDTCLADAAAFRAGSRRLDDVTMMVIRRNR